MASADDMADPETVEEAAVLRRLGTGEEAELTAEAAARRRRILTYPATGRFRTMEEDISGHSSLAAAAASLLTDDLIVEILSRLPFRSVHRCKCVCKLWRDLIAHPAHRRKLPQTLAGFLYKTWLPPDFISFPGAYRHQFGAIGLSQGCLYYATRSKDRVRVFHDDGEDTHRVASKIAVWCLEDYGSQKWVLKHSVRIDKLLNVVEMEYTVAGFHPDRDTIFFVIRGMYDGDSHEDASLASWDMRRRESRTVLDLEKGSCATYLPYVPMFSDPSLLADGHVH